MLQMTVASNLVSQTRHQHKYSPERYAVEPWHLIRDCAMCYYISKFQMLKYFRKKESPDLVKLKPHRYKNRMFEYA